MERKLARPNDSGWFIGITGEENQYDTPDGFKACYSYQLLKLRPEVMKVLQLADGYLVVFDEVDVEAVLNPENDEM